MPDSSTLPAAEGGRADSGGKTNWPLMIGMGGAAVVLLVVLLKKGGSSATGTTAAGTSINAALGSIQEQNMNIMGQVGQARADVMNQANGNDQQLANELAAVDHNIVANVGGQGALSQATMGYMISPQDPRVQQWLELYQQLNDANAGGISNVPTFGNTGTQLSAFV